MLLITTARKPSMEARTLCKRLRGFTHFPYVNRGKMSLEDVVNTAAELGCDHVMLVSDFKRRPGRLEILDLDLNATLSLFISVARLEKFKWLKKKRITVVGRSEVARRLYEAFGQNAMWVRGDGESLKKEGRVVFVDAQNTVLEFFDEGVQMILLKIRGAKLF